MKKFLNNLNIALRKRTIMRHRCIDKGWVADWDVKLTDVIHEYVDFVFCGYEDRVDIRLK